MKKIFPAGKLPLAVLKRFLDKYAIIDKSVIVGPDIGLDAAVIEFGDSYLLAKTDPSRLFLKI